MAEKKTISIHGLRHTHFQQLMAYLDHCEEEGWYYGQKEYFEKRHKELRLWLEDILNNLKERRGK